MTTAHLVPASPTLLSAAACTTAPSITSPSSTTAGTTLPTTAVAPTAAARLTLTFPSGHRCAHYGYVCGWVECVHRHVIRPENVLAADATARADRTSGDAVILTSGGET